MSDCKLLANIISWNSEKCIFAVINNQFIPSLLAWLIDQLVDYFLTVDQTQWFITLQDSIKNDQ